MFDYTIYLIVLIAYFKLIPWIREPPYRSKTTIVHALNKKMIKGDVFDKLIPKVYSIL